MGFSSAFAGSEHCKCEILLQESSRWFVGLGTGGEESGLVTATGGKRPHLAQGALSWAQLAKGREAGDSPHQISSLL